MGRDLGLNIYHNRLYENEGFPELINLIDPAHRRVLDIGCGNGANMRLLTRGEHEPVGITLSTAEATACRSQGLECVICDITQGFPFVSQSFDALLFSHVLEHVPFPESVLKSSLRLLRPKGGVYVVLPNALHLTQRWQFLRGQFRYTETGPLDRTHLRFFDFESGRQLLVHAGLTITQHFGIGQCPAGPLRELAPSLSRRIDRLASKKWPSLFAFHIVVKGKLVN